MLATFVAAFSGYLAAAMLIRIVDRMATPKQARERDGQ